MKKTILFLSFMLLTCVGISHAQAVFKKHGFNKKPLTLSKGKYNEFFTNDEVVQIGTVRFNTRTNKVIQLLEEDTTKNNYLSDRSSIWYSVDPLAEKFPNYSPYVYCFNNPVKYFDPDGRQGMAGPRMSYWTEHLSPEQKQEVGKLALRYFTPVEDLYGAFSGKNFDGESYNRAGAATMAILGIIPISELSKGFKMIPAFLKYSDEAAKLVKFTGKLSPEAKEIITITKSGTFSDAKTVVKDIIGDLGEDAKNYVSRVKESPFYEKIIGKQSADGKRYWRIDADAKTGEAHINWVNGKSKGSIPFKGGYENAQRIIENELIK